LLRQRRYWLKVSPVLFGVHGQGSPGNPVRRKPKSLETYSGLR
jgi:hypothetical protein